MYMREIFPLNIKIGQIQGVISILKEHGGEISLQEISDEALQEATDIVNVIQACKMLGFVKIKGENIKLSRNLKKRGLHDINAEMSKKLVKKEPFSQIIREIRKTRDITTTELFHSLVSKGLINYRDNLSGIKMFKKDLLILGLRLNIIEYDHDTDVWKIAKRKRLFSKN